MIWEKVACTLRCERLELGRGLDLVGRLLDLGHQVGLGGHEVARARTRWPPWTRIRSVPSGTLSMRATTPATPTS